MADATTDEDAPVSSFHNPGNNDDNDPSDELQDFRFLAALTSTNNGKHTIPKRGEKDFEPHGTRHQDGVLEESRKAMHDALDYTRVHLPKNRVRAWFFGEGIQSRDLDEEEGANVDILSEAVRGRGLERDRVVMVENSKGTHFRTMGRTALGTLAARMWLLPEEALYLVERGNLDLWWPARPLMAAAGQFMDEDESSDDGLPLSLQATYALLIGDHGEEGKVSLDEYTVYANLKRTGYVVMRFKEDLEGQSRSERPAIEKVSVHSKGLFNLLFGSFFAGTHIDHGCYGPLVQPGLYRSYNDVYKNLSVIARHTPSQLGVAPSPNQPFKLIYQVWKPSRIPTFAKSSPGSPDFQIAVVSSRSTAVPSLAELDALLQSTPWDPPKKEWIGPEKSYQRLKHGWRNVVLAVVDQGIISYLRMSEGAFGEERLHERFDRGPGGAGKRGGFRGKGGRGGRGRGKGR